MSTPEQTISVGASLQNLMLALHAKGYDAIVGFIYAGTIATPPRQIERAQPEIWVRHLVA